MKEKISPWYFLADPLLKTQPEIPKTDHEIKKLTTTERAFFFWLQRKRQEKMVDSIPHPQLSQQLELLAEKYFRWQPGGTFSQSVPFHERLKYFDTRVENLLSQLQEYTIGELEFEATLKAIVEYSFHQLQLPQPSEEIDNPDFYTGVTSLRHIHDT